MSKEEVSIFDKLSLRDHEHVSFFFDPLTGLKAIVAIHNTTLGPSLGGCRMRVYQNDEAALEDALRLSEGMTYKAAAAGLNLGGGKGVILLDSKDSKIDRQSIFSAYGRFVQRLGGLYITAEDMGTSVEDMMIVRKETEFVVGKSESEGGIGDPSVFTARGVVMGMKAGVQEAIGSPEMKGRRVLIEGVGAVGGKVAKTLAAEGAELFISDSSEALLKKVSAETGAKIVPIDQLYEIDADVFSPCAIGQTVNQHTVPRLKVKVIAGAANNQLSDSSMYDLLQAKSVTYVPDFIINSGGLIAASSEVLNPKGSILQMVDNIFATVSNVLQESKRRQRFPEIVAMELAKERIQQAKQKKAA